MSVAEGVPPEAIEDRYDGQGYGQFKSDVAEAVIAFLEPVRQRYEELSATPASSSGCCAGGAEQAAAAAEPDAPGDVRPHGVRPALRRRETQRPDRRHVRH